MSDRPDGAELERMLAILGKHHASHRMELHLYRMFGRARGEQILRLLGVSRLEDLS